MYKTKYLIEGVEIPNEEVYNKIIDFFEKLKDNGQWYKIHPTKTLITRLTEMFNDPEKEGYLLKITKKDNSPNSIVWWAQMDKEIFDIDSKDMFYIEFSEEEIRLINEIGLFTVEEALHSLNDKGLWTNYNSGYPKPDRGITEEDIIIEKQVKTLLNIKRGERI